MIQTNIFNKKTPPSDQQKKLFIDFLFEHLEQYGDPKQDIEKCIAYALENRASFGGFIVALMDNETLKGVAIVNKTGMGGYIPENILVYIATHNGYRGEGLGKKIMHEIIENTEGDIALHVEANNSAKFLYEKFGFTNPYLEMRLKK